MKFLSQPCSFFRKTRVMHSHLISRLPGAHEMHYPISTIFIPIYIKCIYSQFYNYTTGNSIISIITQISSLEQITISSPMTYTHNYIPYNCDILLIHEVHALTYPFPHKSSHSFHQFQAPNTWTFFVHFTQTRDYFYSPKTEHVGCPWAAHSSNLCSSLLN